MYVVKDGDNMDNKFSVRLFDLIVEQRITPTKFAFSMGISPNTVYNWLRGDCLPNLQMFFKICEFYGVEPVWLWGGNE